MKGNLSTAELIELRTLLQRRLQIIGDTDLRDRDPDAQLEQLKEVGEGLFAAHERLKPRLPGELNHYLERCSYDKALAFVEEMAA